MSLCTKAGIRYIRHTHMIARVCCVHYLLHSYFSSAPLAAHPSAAVQRPEHLGLAYEHADLLQQRRSIRREDLPVALIPLQALANLFRDLEHVLLEGDRLE